MANPLRRLANRIAAPYVAALAARADRHHETLQSSFDAVQQDLAQLARRDELQGSLAALEARAVTLERYSGRADEMLRHIYEEDALQRRRLYELRASEEYELAFSEAEPLVSFVIPTYNRFESLRDVSLPSLLGQSYSNIEVIVSGDGSPPETERVVEEFGDPRVRFHNRSVRGPYPEDPKVRWFMIGTPPFNDGLSLAKGRWIAALGDDDSARPEHTEILLAAAQRNRYEHCYGRHQVHYRSGETLSVGAFPPRRGEYVLQTSLIHAGLRFFQLEPADYLYAEPNDWSLCRRMLVAGVRFGMVEDFLADKYESRYESHDDWGRYGEPSVD
jgi:hypothetical protein